MPTRPQASPVRHKRIFGTASWLVERGNWTPDPHGWSWLWGSNPGKIEYHCCSKSEWVGSYFVPFESYGVLSFYSCRSSQFGSDLRVRDLEYFSFVVLEQVYFSIFDIVSTRVTPYSSDCCSPNADRAKESIVSCSRHAGWFISFIILLIIESYVDVVGKVELWVIVREFFVVFEEYKIS